MQSVKKIGREFEWWLRELRLAPKVLRQYGTRYPTRVKLPDMEIYIYIDPWDRRARKQLLFDLIRGRSHRNSRFWRDFVDHIDPDAALDIGANYGECVFGTMYAPGVRVFALEANPELIPYLLESRDDHPSKSQIEVMNNLVSDKAVRSVPFFLNRASSGRSTAVAAIASDSGTVEAVDVAAVRVDDILANAGLRPEKLVFKVDVEGFEPRVLIGMKDTLEKASLAVGYVEIDSRFLSRSGWTIERYDSEIIRDFELYVPVDQKSLVLKHYDSLTAYRKTFGGQRIHTDLVLVKNIQAREWLPTAWQLAR